MQLHSLCIAVSCRRLQETHYSCEGYICIMGGSFRGCVRTLTRVSTQLESEWLQRPPKQQRPPKGIPDHLASSRGLRPPAHNLLTQNAAEESRRSGGECVPGDSPGCGKRETSSPVRRKRRLRFSRAILLRRSNFALFALLSGCARACSAGGNTANICPMLPRRPPSLQFRPVGRDPEAAAGDEVFFVLFPRQSRQPHITLAAGNGVAAAGTWRGSSCGTARGRRWPSLASADGAAQSRCFAGAERPARGSARRSKA